MIVLLMVMVGGGAAGAYALTHRGPHGTSTAASASSTATPAIPAGFHMYTDSATHVQFVIPQDWTTTGSVGASNGLLAESPDHSSALGVKQFNAVGDNTKTATELLTGAAGSGGVTNEAGPTNVSLAGQTWVQESGDVTNSSFTLHTVVLVATHSDSTFTIAYASPTSTFTAVNAQYFQPILKSFTFLQ